MASVVGGRRLASRTFGISGLEVERRGAPLAGRPAEQIALAGGDAELADDGQLLARLDALGDDRGAVQRAASSWRARRTPWDGSCRIPPWTSDRSILTMSKWISLSSRSPALPAPTSSAARRIPARRQAAALRAELLEVLDLLALGQLDDELLGRDAAAVGRWPSARPGGTGRTRASAARG